MDGRGTLSVELDGVALAEDRPLSHGTLGAGRYLRLTVRDSGHGMDAATLERIFEPFFTTKPVGRGTGLGLASVHGIVADHGGALHVESMPGRGSTFAAYVPRALADACPAPAEAPAEPPRGQGGVIMVVDDERALVLLGEEMLAALGYEPVGYESAAGALAAFRREPNRFDLVLSDEDMAELTGTQLAAAIHAIRPGVPVILMTGHADAVGHAVHRQAGVRELLRKPLRAGDLATSIARSLDSVG
ncbi:MAG TPA: ATP-binding protein [Geminicoccaceae bacterium]|nr:ATP-binding protein [Geminicoccaceae bacterium]